MKIKPTAQLRQVWLKIRSDVESAIRAWKPSPQLLKKLKCGSLRDSRIAFFGKLTPDSLLQPIAKARAALLIFAYTLNREQGFLGEMRALKGIMEEEENEVLNLVSPTLQDKVNMLKLNVDEAVFILGIAAENLEFDWPNGSGLWRRNLSPSNNLGEFFTPHEVLNYIITNTYSKIEHDDSSLTVIDPFGGVGGAIFLYHRHLEGDSRYKGQIKRYVVIEKNPIFASLAADILNCLSFPKTEVQVFCGDSLLLDAELINQDPKGSQPSVKALLATADLVATNPPYTRMKFHRNEFKAKESYLGEISDKEIDEYILLKKKEIADYKNKLKSFTELSPAMQGEWDIYRLGLMRCLSLLKPTGVLGIITPCSVLADFRCSRLREHILRSYSLKNVSVVGESIKLFRTVNQPTAIYILHREENPVTSVCGHVDSWEHISEITASQTITNEEILDKIGRPYPIPICESNLLGLYRKLISIEKIAHYLKGGVKRGELDLTMHKQYLTGNTHATQLIRGDNIERYTTRPCSEERKMSRAKASLFFSKVRKGGRSLLMERRLVGRQVSYMGKKRRLSWVLVSGPVIVSNSCNYIAESDCNLPLETLEVLLNSCVLDWFFRTTSTNNHVGNYEIDQCPVPPLSKETMAELGEYGNQLKKDYQCKPFGISGRAISDLEREVDRYVLHLYGATRIRSELLFSLYYN